MIIGIASIFYFVIGIVLIVKFGWYGFAMSYTIGMGLGYFQMKFYGEKIDQTWLFLAPLALFICGGIAGSIVALPFQILGIIPSSSNYVSDEDFWSHK